MTLTIPDVEQWKPDELTTAGTAVGKLSGSLDQAVLGAVNGTRDLGTAHTWSGAAAQAADARMHTEQTRASAVSQALLHLQTALGQQVTNLNNTKQNLLRLRDNAEHPPAPNGAPSDLPGFEVGPNGHVDATKRMAFLREHRGNLSDAQFWGLIGDILLDASQREVDITNALKQAESVAEQAITAVNQAKTEIDNAYTGLGDPVTGAGAAPPAPPAATVPSAAAPPAAAPPPASGIPLAGAPISVAPAPALSGIASGGGHSAHGGSFHAGGGSYHGGGGYATTSYTGSGSIDDSIPTAMPSGDVAQWIAQAKQVLIQMGYPPDAIDENAIALIIQHESGGDPLIVNTTDSNAAAGHPSKGLMQTIDGTFNAYAADGHRSIFNPVDNIVAASRYAIARYGSLDNVPGVIAVRHGGSYVGY
ncbi:transglycosylase SLT domain-containing protein [Nocardia terpenica]|uniref:transglycosylase SLT domain-containing protein n=1 Tax=Nocardia terpenica TaxID=455432 RepID=UPI001895E5C2|nr:transglycosylase SLT domain-containing protein [Nocardia terpenica]MBF6060235.1 transglycosylase SLT domain-containing protein [Nocardia terpenica]MBF6103495.1 transglycosylase SLT domain-containing protein [Nocardia terpenica]MBF6112131.1 transglycosylase SLT domain-containing protein [Nocardia terpenica]MBF6117716.1 transglycosylase SLT domain-containing protein [Nocardia terpenica]MBF6153540.1 transglycosylase SLT domain-containing protein [Nocardia terpenica]